MKKSYIYVVVFTNEGAKFVTKVDTLNKSCEWNGKEQPYKFNSKEVAKDVAMGLTLNLNFAVVVDSNYELTEQPYNYDRGHFEWRRED